MVVRTGWGRRGLLLLVAVALVACSGGSGEDNTQPPSRATDAGWDDLLSADDDGVVSAESALEAFVVAIGPLPGVDRPDIGELEAESGTAAVRAVLSHWDELSEQQREAVNGYLNGDSQSGARSGPILAMTRVFPIAAEPDETQLLVLIDQMTARIEADLGRALSTPIELRIAPNLAQGDAAAFVNATDASGGFFGPMTKCTIVVTKDGLDDASEIVNGIPSDRLTYIMAHEAFHCFEAAYSDNLSQSYSRPNWIVEGMAEWVGASYSNTASRDAWRLWLEFPSLSLFMRQYSAIGFWAHLQEHGAPVWQVIDPILLASKGGSIQAYEVAISSAGPDVLQTWASGAYRDSTRPPNWDQDGPAILDIRAEPTKVNPTIASGQSWSIEIGKLEANTWDTDIQAQVVTLVSDGPGLILLADETELSLPGAEVLCTIAGGCTCPSGSPGAAAVFRVVSPGPARIGLAGHLEGTTLQANGWSLDDFCQEYEPTGTIDACLVGQWSSTRFTATDHVVKSGTGTGISLVVRGSGDGYVDFSEHVPVILRAFPDPEAPDVQVLQEGAAWLKLVPAGSGRAQVLGGTTLDFSVKGQVDLGDGWIDAGPGIQAGGTSIGAGGQIVCDDDGGLRLGLPNEFTGYFFERVADSGDIPSEPPDATPIGGAGGSLGSGGDTGSGAGAPPPDWGLNYDACLILTAEEIAALLPGVQTPAAEDDNSSQFFHQCSFLPALSLQITPPSGPEFVDATADYFEAEFIEISGVTEWGRAVVDDSVIIIAGGNEMGTVTIVPWFDVAPGTGQYDALVTLLKIALSRL